jgi:tyrosine-specific transport protein
MSKKRLFISVATLVGCIVGAGMFGVPYVIAKAGFLPGIIAVITIGLLFLLINLYLGEVALRTKGNYYLSHYAEKYLGRAGKQAMFISLVIGIYGALIAYAFGQGAALSSLTGIDSLLGGVIVFAALSIAVLAGLNFISYAESVILPVVIGFTLLIFFYSIPSLEPSNYSGFSFDGIIVPFGVLLFAFMGTSAIPELKEQLDKDKKLLKKAILLGSIIPIFIYLLFTAAIVGLYGELTPEIATLGIEARLAPWFFYIGGLFPLLTMSTSFMALGLALSRVFTNDYGLRRNSAWLLTCFVPFIIFVILKALDIGGFASILDITGILTGVLAIILVVLMAYSAKRLGDRKPEYSVYINKPIAFLIITLVLIGGIIELAKYIV